MCGSPVGLSVCTTLWLNCWLSVTPRVWQLCSVQDSFPNKSTTIKLTAAGEHVCWPVKEIWVESWQHVLQPCFQLRFILTTREKAWRNLFKQSKGFFFFHESLSPEMGSLQVDLCTSSKLALIIFALTPFLL